MNRRVIIAAVCVLAAPLAGGIIATQSAVAAPATQPARTDFAQGVLFPHFYLDRAMNGRVDKNGLVDYASLKGDKNLDTYLQAVATADLTLFPSWEIAPEPTDNSLTGNKNPKPRFDRSPELVFWINAYNAHVLKTICDAYPVDSTDEIKDFNTAKTHAVAGKMYSFQDMKAYIAQLDPRALFTLADGTQGGPLLANTAYRLTGINAQLDKSAAVFVSDIRNVHVMRIANKVTVSDFFQPLDTYFATPGNRKKNSGVRTLLVAYSNQHSDRSYMTTGDYVISFEPRDRKLNSQTHTG